MPGNAYGATQLQHTTNGNSAYVALLVSYLGFALEPGWIATIASTAYVRVTSTATKKPLDNI